MTVLSALQGWDLTVVVNSSLAETSGRDFHYHLRLLMGGGALGPMRFEVCFFFLHEKASLKSDISCFAEHVRQTGAAAMLSGVIYPLRH